MAHPFGEAMAVVCTFHTYPRGLAHAIGAVVIGVASDASPLLDVAWRALGAIGVGRALSASTPLYVAGRGRCAIDVAGALPTQAGVGLAGHAIGAGETLAVATGQAVTDEWITDMAGLASQAPARVRG